MENCWQEGHKQKATVVNTEARAACASKDTVLSPMLTLKSAQPHLHGLYSVSTSVSHGGGGGAGGEAGGGGGEQMPWQIA
eukprot:scaffold7662_cov55-Phaeocystis_antarctica.AAC.1